MTCRQVPTDGNKCQENICWQFTGGKSGHQGHATSTKIFANNLLEGLGPAYQFENVCFTSSIIDEIKQVFYLASTLG